MNAPTSWIAIAAIVLAIVGCDNAQPIKIGFAGGLTGRVNDLGKEGRDGVILAVEQVNTQGGINGRAIDLIIKDDRQDKATALKIDRELIEEGVVAIIGHMTSSMSMAAVPLINSQKIMMISPTASTNELTGKDDNFLRTYPPSKQAAQLLARHVRDEMGLKTMTVVYDDGNRAHSLSWMTAFRDELEKRGSDGTVAKVVRVRKFASGMNFRASEVARDIVDADADGLFILANALDTALICQQLRKLGSYRPIVVSQWSVTTDLLRHGGDSVNGIVFFHTFDRDNQSPEFLEFKDAFHNRFGYAPAFAAAHAYDAAQVLVDALKSTDDPQKIKATILNKGTYKGLQTDLVFDRFGDVHRKRFLMTIRDGTYVPLAN